VPGFFLLGTKAAARRSIGAQKGKRTMTDSEQKPRCKYCGNQMLMTRFQSEVTDRGIDKEYAYECLWCEDSQKLTFHVPHPRSKELAA
jgi:hypothetical protein